MKIAMMTNSYKPYVAGVPISIERLARGLRELGHEAVVFAPTYKEQKAEEDIVRYRSFLQGVVCGFSVPDSLDLRIEKEFKDGHFDVIHVHHPMLIGRTAAYLSAKYAVPLVFTYHTRYEQYLHYLKASWMKDFVPWYIRQFTAKCSMVLAPTECMKSLLEETGVKSRVEVLPTGIPREQFEPDGEKASALRKTLADGRKYLFLTVCRLAKEKNIEFLLQSLALRKYGAGGGRAEADFRLAVVGEGPEKENLVRKAEELGLSGDVVFTGRAPNDEIKNYCAAADCFLFASTSETQGIVLLEAMAAGIPVAAVQATGTEDIVENGVNGYMTELSETAFAGGIGDVLEPSRRKALCQGAFETALDYSSMKIAKKAAAYYKMAICGNKEKPWYEQSSRWKYA